MRPPPNAVQRRVQEARTDPEYVILRSERRAPLPGGDAYGAIHTPGRWPPPRPPRAARTAAARARAAPPRSRTSEIADVSGGRHALTTDFLRTGHNVLLRGPSSVGKTTLAQNLGQRALETGHTARFETLASILADLLRQESSPALERRLRRYVPPDLLHVDELGYLPCDQRASELLRKPPGKYVVAG